MKTDELIFVEESHTYSKNGVGFDSVSSVIAFFEEEFPEDMMSRVVAKKRGITQREVLGEWAAKRDEACRWGKHVHAALELVELKKYDEFQHIDEYSERLVPIVDSYNEWRADLPKKSLPEIMLHSDEYNVAGMCDLPIVQGKHVDVYDFKTNEKIDYVSKYNKFFNAPFSYLTDCKYTRYSIQLTLYAYMLELKGYKPRKLGILWFDEDGQIHEIPVPYQKALAEQMLAFYRAVNPIV